VIRNFVIRNFVPAPSFIILDSLSFFRYLHKDKKSAFIRLDMSEYQVSSCTRNTRSHGVACSSIYEMFAKMRIRIFWLQRKSDPVHFLIKQDPNTVHMTHFHKLVVSWEAERILLEICKAQIFL